MIPAGGAQDARPAMAAGGGAYLPAAVCGGAYLPAAVCGGAYLPAAVCGPFWRVLRAYLARHRADGGQVAPDVAAALDVLRAAHLAHLVETTANEPVRADGPNIGASSATDSGPVRTGDLAARLGVTEQHARRLARRAGVTPVSRGLWAAQDAAALVAARRGRPRR
ncbi:hypothetical protein [Actinomadura violacea]|uniref:Uncharacterized protein n=1 Tax=Actinomadura violacea TaxID=2819934 RepID=A0ABS3RII5_9ACTN|nr:hypothetical protein [Actinomadura violacea]MBO2456554.1 hypothetical protein [Actinomadura violacea]